MRTGAKAGWVLYTHSETIYPMGGIGLQTGFEKGKGCEITNYNYKNPRGRAAERFGVRVGSG